MKLTITNRTPSRIALNEFLGTIEGNRTQVYDLTVDQLEKAGRKLTQLRLAGFINWSTSDDPAIDNQAEGATVSLVGQGGSSELVLADFGTQDVTQGRYTDWYDLMAKLASLQFGASPKIRLALETGPFTVPLAGMPPTGWDFRGGNLTSFYGASGTEVLNVPAGVKLDNLFGMGGAALGDGAVIMKIDPPPGTSVLEFSALPVGTAFIFVIGGGSGVDHSTNTGALMRGPNASTTMVLVSNSSQQNTGLVPPLSGPLLELGATDGAVGVQFNFGGLPDNWLVGGGLGSGLLSIFDTSANVNTKNPGVWVPGFTGGGGTIYFNFDKAQFLNYTPTSLPNWSGIAPDSVADALDRIAAAIGPIA